MDCTTCREAISARLDGHDSDDPAVDEHLAGCAGCQAWRADAVALAHHVDLHAALPVPDHSASILAALADETAAAEASARNDALLVWRAGLAALGAVQLLLAIPVLFGVEAGVGVHAAREMGSFDVALAAGFLVAAWRPARAWGMVPLVAALAGSLAFTSVIDIVEGRATLAAETLHLTDVVGLVLLWALAHAYRRPLPPRTLASL
jgi:predicted anti-sigma-YlaC factor YlaD